MKPRHDFFLKEIQRGDNFIVVEIADVEHTHEVIRADLLHLRRDLARDAVRVAGDHIAGVDQAIPIELGKIAPLAVTFAEVVERTFRGQGCHQPLVHRSLVDRFVKAAIKDCEKIAHRRLGDLLRLFIGLIDVYMTA